MTRTAAAAFLGIALLLGAAPARADLIGILINEVIGSIVRAGANPAPEPDQREDLRGIPPAAEAGEMSPPKGRLVEIDGKALRLSPGCQIRDVHNRIVQPGRVLSDTEVRYVLDRRGDVHRVWLMEAG